MNSDRAMNAPRQLMEASASRARCGGERPWLYRPPADSQVKVVGLNPMKLLRFRRDVGTVDQNPRKIRTHQETV